MDKKGQLNFGLNNKKKTKRESIPMIWRDNILRKQKNLCVGPHCAEEHNGKRVGVNTRNNFDHIKALALGGKHTEKNLQALCPNCHLLKTREDRYKISQLKKKNKQNNVQSGGNILESSGEFNISDVIYGSKKKSKKKKKKDPLSMAEEINRQLGV